MELCLAPLCLLAPLALFALFSADGPVWLGLVVFTLLVGVRGCMEVLLLTRLLESQQRLRNDGDVQHHTQNSPYVAVCLAAYMGAARIGLIPPLPSKTLPALTINPLHSISAETDQIGG